jgi:hypothetical protein
MRPRSRNLPTRPESRSNTSRDPTPRLKRSARFRALESRESTPDVYLLVVWPGILAELRSFLGDEAHQHLDAAVKNDTVDGKLVAMPFFVETGVLYY